MSDSVLHIKDNSLLLRTHPINAAPTPHSWTFYKYPALLSSFDPIISSNIPSSCVLVIYTKVLPNQEGLGSLCVCSCNNGHDQVLCCLDLSTHCDFHASNSGWSLMSKNQTQIHTHMTCFLSLLLATQWLEFERSHIWMFGLIIFQVIAANEQGGIYDNKVCMYTYIPNLFHCLEGRGVINSQDGVLEFCFLN